MSNNKINKEYKKAFAEHIQARLKEINENYNYIINWYIDIEKRKMERDPRIDIHNKDVFIVLTPLPSRAYGDNSIAQQLEITALCDMNEMSDVMDVLSEYQDSAVQNKWWTDEGVLVNESWFSPSIQETLFNLNVGKGSIISMQGSVSFTPDVVDIEKVLIFDEQVKLFEFFETTSGDSVPNAPAGTTRRKAKNRSQTYTINLKCKSSANSFCQTLKQWKDGKISVNVDIPVKLIYTDSTEANERHMVINSAVFTTTDGTIPTWSVQLMERM